MQDAVDVIERGHLDAVPLCQLTGRTRRMHPLGHHADFAQRSFQTPTSFPVWSSTDSCGHAEQVDNRMHEGQWVGRTTRYVDGRPNLFEKATIDAVCVLVEPA
jgi:hypothetical protein